MITLPLEKVINLQNVPVFWEAESLKLMLIKLQCISTYMLILKVMKK
jgi:hypothetical protein